MKRTPMIIIFTIYFISQVTMILYESLRLYPPIATRTRRTKEETKLGELDLPKGALLFMPAILSHHDKKFGVKMQRSLIQRDLAKG